MQKLAADFVQHMADFPGFGELVRYLGAGAGPDHEPDADMPDTDQEEDALSGGRLYGRMTERRLQECLAYQRDAGEADWARAVRECPQGYRGQGRGSFLKGLRQSK
jgi:hypothetical protein